MSKVLKVPYKAWRVFDIRSNALGDQLASPRKFELAPAQIVRVFGPPCYLDSVYGASGTFDFEDNRLSLFKLMDHYEVTEYINPKKVQYRHPPYSHRGKQGPLPTIDEFWQSEQPYKFWLTHSEYADIDAFKAWIKTKLEENEDIKAKVETMFGPVDYFDDYDKEYEIKRDYAVFKYNKENWG